MEKGVSEDGQDVFKQYARGWKVRILTKRPLEPHLQIGEFGGGGGGGGGGESFLGAFCGGGGIWAVARRM